MSPLHVLQILSKNNLLALYHSVSAWECCILPFLRIAHHFPASSWPFQHCQWRQHDIEELCPSHHVAEDLLLSFLPEWGSQNFVCSCVPPDHLQLICFLIKHPIACTELLKQGHKVFETYMNSESVEAILYTNNFCLHFQATLQKNCRKLQGMLSHATKHSSSGCKLNASIDECQTPTKSQPRRFTLWLKYWSAFDYDCMWSWMTRTWHKIQNFRFQSYQEFDSLHVARPHGCKDVHLCRHCYSPVQRLESGCTTSWEWEYSRAQ